MPVSISVGVSDAEDTSQAFMAAAEDAAAGLDGGCYLCVVFAGGAHLHNPHGILEIVNSRLAPTALVGCGAGGVIGGDQELEDDAGAVVWALSSPDAEVETMELTSVVMGDEMALGGLPDDPAELG